MFYSQARKFFVGGNWKANGSTSQVQSLVSMLNSGRTAASTEVVVAPPSVFVGDVRSKLRKDFSVCAQVRVAGTELSVWRGARHFAALSLKRCQ